MSSLTSRASVWSGLDWPVLKASLSLLSSKRYDRGLLLLFDDDENMKFLKVCEYVDFLLQLELSDNRISGGLQVLKDCLNLTVLNLSNNKIKDMESLGPLKDLSNLKSVDLYRNEVTQVEDYRDKVFALLPGLTYLDGKSYGMIQEYDSRWFYVNSSSTNVCLNDEGIDKNGGEYDESESEDDEQGEVNGKKDDDDVDGEEEEEDEDGEQNIDIG